MRSSNSPKLATRVLASLGIFLSSGVALGAWAVLRGGSVPLSAALVTVGVLLGLVVAHYVAKAAVAPIADADHHAPGDRRR